MQVQLALSWCLAATAAAAASLPVLPLAIAPAGSWPAAGAAACGGAGAYCGDVRAVVSVGAGDIVAGMATAQLFWRRRDPTPENKKVLVLDAAGAACAVLSSTVEATCGVVSFAAAQPGTFHVYYLPFLQDNGGAATTFSWQGCNDTAYDESNPCVLGRRLEGAGASVCATATPAAALAVRVESRDGFNSFTDMEVLAAPAEVAAATAALAALPVFVGVFPEARDRSVRVFDAIPFRWTPGGGGPNPFGGAPALRVGALRGEFAPLQLGLWAFGNAVSNITAAASDLRGPGGVTIPAAAVTFINLQGVDISGTHFFNTRYSIEARRVGSLWVGVRVPADIVPGAFSGTLTVSTLAAPSATVAVALTLDVSPEPAVPFDGAGNVTSLARLSWLYSTRGLEDSVPSPFVAVSVTGGGGSGVPLSVACLLKTAQVAENGLFAGVDVSSPRLRRGRQSSSTNAVLASPMRFELIDVAGNVLAAQVTSPAAVTALSNSSVSWAAASSVAVPGAGTLTLSVAGSLDMASWATFAVTVSNPGGASAALGDVRLTVPVSARMRGYIVGMSNGGAEACPYEDRLWRWTNTTNSNKVWVGRPEGGILVSLRGDGIAWESPMFGADYPVVPFVPPTWGGVSALPTDNLNGANVTAGNITAISGARTLAAGEAVTFLFDVALTPSKLVDWSKHWSTRAFQVGYANSYSSPQTMKAMGVSAVTLHQGTPGIINGSLINPWINYPFLDDTVPLLTNYSTQANELDMLVRYYYTVRELSSRAVETFAFLAQQGELFLDQDAYTIVQPGYAHAWNTHGGSAYLHQHVVSNYGACWQQPESNGEWDPALCSIGVSRLFNFYVEGLFWGMSQAPFMNGNYYDG